MASKTFKATVDIPDDLLLLTSADFDAQLDARLVQAFDAEAKEEARDWARGLWSAHIKDANERTSRGEEVAHDGLRQPQPKVPFA